ncbi:MULTISPECIES: hypothetical protein [Paenarthrobacter]|uniref:hypothetical protein n=1 Tax=Paenarthrobacter TaxID=1742992 RepID=UPI001C4AE156|nr:MULTISPECIES: hypothetical protein [Paenarthrobacter]
MITPSSISAFAQIPYSQPATRTSSDVAVGRVPLTLACGDYDRTWALRTGSVQIPGVALTYLPLKVEETFFRMVSYREFDVAELSLSTYLLTLSQETPPFVAIPVFPSRMFRHSGIYINTQSGISSPSDLSGKVVGVPEYQVTAAVWIRGILEEHYGVPVDSVRYRTGGLHETGRVEKFPLRPGTTTEIRPIGPEETLSQLLVDGEIDALYSPRTPQPFVDNHPNIARLFPDSGAQEADYFRSTGIFPIMHVVVIRREVYEANRWIARSLQNAFEESKRVAAADIDQTVALGFMLPWLHDEVARTRSIMGSNWWPYGVGENSTTLSTFLRYSFAQGLADRLWEPEQIFAPECLNEVRI